MRRPEDRRRRLRDDVTSVATDQHDSPERESIRRITRRGIVGVVTGNLAGAVVVFVFLAFVIPPVPNAPNFTCVNLIAFVAYMLVAIPVGTIWSQRLALETRTWQLERRAPTPRERELTLRYPLRQLVVEAVLWFAAGVLFTAINLTYSGETGLQVAIATLLGGVAACASSYLIIERA